MSRSVLAAVLLLLLSGKADAICGIEPLESKLLSAHSVFVATLTSASLADGPGSLKANDFYRVNYSFVVSERLKGEPDPDRFIYTINRYDNFGDGPDVGSGESVRLLPGDNVLVFAEATGDIQVHLCTPSNKLDENELSAVKSALTR